MKPIDTFRLRPIDSSKALALHSVVSTRGHEAALAASLPPHELMARAGASVARLALALAPHARRIWIACGPGNNGGDGLIAAAHLMDLPQARQGALELVVTFCGDPASLPPDARWALSQAKASGVAIGTQPPAEFDLGVDALLGIGASRAPQGEIAEQLNRMHALGRPVLAVDVPSGLMPDTGVYLGPASHQTSAERHTLSLLTLKPGLFTADGRDLAGSVWFDPLAEACVPGDTPAAVLSGQAPASLSRPHCAHKGTQGDVVVWGGEDISRDGAGMTGAAVLAARAALHAGAGRVYVGLLGQGDDGQVRWDPQCPELMFRATKRLAQDEQLLRSATVVCGCGGGSAIATDLPLVLSRSRSLVLDADALNRIAEDDALRTLLRNRQDRERITVLTPHPLEAARLLRTDTNQIMADRMKAAQSISNDMGVICVLKGTGTVVTVPGEVPHINPTGNPALATAGTGDVLAGLIGARLAAGNSPWQAVLEAVHTHGRLADQWILQQTETLTAHRLAMGMTSG